MFSRYQLRRIKNLSIIPRWVIFILDMSVGTFCFLLAYLIKNEFNFGVFQEGQIGQNLLILLAFNISLFSLFKVYAGIIRFTGLQDTFRIFFVVFFANVGYYVLDLFILQWYGFRLIPASVLVINMLLSFVGLSSYRVIIKYFFSYITTINVTKKRVAIFGAGDVGISTKRALEHDMTANIQMVLFIEDDQRKVGKNIDGIKICSSSQLELLLKQYLIDELIIATTKLPSKRKNEIVDFCLDNKIEVFTVPPLKSWINGQLSTKQLQNVKIEDLLEREQIKLYNEILFKQLNNKTVLVTGAAGSIGSEIVRQLLQYKPKTIVLNDCAETPLHDLKLELEELGCNNFILALGDVRNELFVDKIFQDFHPQFVYHAAAYKHVPMMENSPLEAICTNVGGTKLLADLSIKYGVERFVMISTDKAVNPTNVMGASKRIAEMYVQSLYQNQELQFQSNLSTTRTKFITTRFGNVLGSNGSVIPRFKKQIEAGGPVTVTHPDITRYFMTIPEACQLVLEAGSMGNGGEIFVFDMGQPVKIADLARKMVRLSGLVPDEDIKIEYSGLRPGEKLYEELLNNAENTLNTYHEKILIAKTRTIEYASLSIQIDGLIGPAKRQESVNSIVKAMKELVPEFISNNSEFEQLDAPKVINMNKVG
ncbi:nucleoside-diphosphate sugar epimerase/dehydratase [Sediminibacterium sp.]|uniref:polysaccharide biosynthesis protein n=1 Tax=Sediminibacterium sp. TaxID=1917865 RepID=UPI00273766C3|nr:nucleoside-diphosphate sugar epimerase/dehydratase [Sediminibacterium sp.]MDP3392426.1 nucleoside-diphosphate sugar epimerase/dehydratase [Sediminibacterium sp.]MDP3565692.1 nucleoside-diphosphate sugar epimerase/dehydratase [Sediminibacterium sp.]